MFLLTRARRIIFTLLLGLLLLPPTLGHAGGATANTISASAPVATIPDPDSPFGVAGVMRWPDWGTFNQPADAMLQTGGSWVREDFAWGLIEPRENSWNWTPTDRIVQTLRARNLNVLGIISYSANWATPSHDDDNASSPVSMYPPDSSKYYWFVHALVEHYKGSVHYWEVWNEPDNSLFWKPAPNAHEYADLLKAAYRAVKDVDPGAQVLSGGVSGNAIPFLEEVVQNGAGNSFDILALHPYAVPLNLDQAKVESRPDVHKLVEVELNKYRAFLQRHAWKRPIWVTEIGWPAHNWQLDESAQADYLAQAYAQMLASGIPDRIFWYSFKDASTDGADSWGLTAWGGGQTDLSPRRPAFAAYATSARMLASTHAIGRTPAASYTIIDGLKQAGDWTRSFNDQGAFHIATDQHHSGASSGQLKYAFVAPNQAVDFAPPKPISIPGTPTRLGLWVLGDASGDYLSAWLKDRDGELFKVRLGAITGASDGWRYYEASLQSYYFGWEHTGGNPSNGVPDYPLKFAGFRLENTPDEPAGSGTIYIDDLQTTDAPDVSAMRFSRNDGQVVDVLWSAQATQFSLPT
ncbi:MAG: glycosyl hydrolase [Chloroflexota bacterium]|nr:glycosyl hydrolase [Chloroflexota bacterium]